MCASRTELNKITNAKFLGAVTKAALALPDAPNVSEILEIAFIDELQTFLGKKILIRVKLLRHLNCMSKKSKSCGVGVPPALNIQFKCATAYEQVSTFFCQAS